MPTYSITAPNGKTYRIDGPEGATQDQIQTQVLRQFPDAAGTTAAAPAPAPAPRPKAATKPAVNSNDPAQRWAGKDPKQVLQIYNGARAQLVAKITDPVARQAALTRFDSDPRAQAMRKVAGLAPLSTRQQEVRAVAKKTQEQRFQEAGAEVGKHATGLQSFIAGASKGLFGIPQHMQAAYERFAPEALTGNHTDASYSNILQLIRAKDNAAINAHEGAGVSGEIGSTLVGGGVAAKLLMAGAGAAAATGAPVVARVGQVLENLGTLRKGQKAINAAKIAATGAGAGAVQAAGTGENVPEAAAIGGIGAPLFAGGFKVAQVITRPFRDVLRLSSAGRILSRLTTATRDQLQARAAAYRAATGAEPTLFELLPLADRNKILKQVVVGKDNVVEQTANAIRTRAQNLGPEMSNRVQDILEPQRNSVSLRLHYDIADARGGHLEPGDPEMIARAMESPTDMLHLRDQEARAIMAPHETTPVVPNLEDLFPAVAGPGGTRMATDPEVSAVIRSAGGLLRTRAPGAGVTVGDITDMISTLRGDLAKGGIEGRTAERAINHLQDVLDHEVPAAGAAARRMTDAYAARSRMAEGMQEGDATRLRDDVQVGTNRRRAQTVRNAYDTPEGEAGRALGQGNRIINDLGGSPEEALRATVKQSRGSTSRQLSQNVGPTEAEEIGRAARAQDESAQALASASNRAQSGSGDSADVETLVQAVAGLHPSSFITTKAGAMRRLLDMTYIPESRARTMIDMLFSQDRAMTERALRAIGNEANGATFLKAMSVLIGQNAGNISTAAGAPGAGEDTPLSGDAPSVEADLAAAGQSEAPQDGEMTAPADSPYASALQQVYESENPELIELVQRVKGQESGGNQIDPKTGQPTTSSAGAIGIMQVMPDTGPEAANLAGVPWDENAYRTDAAYNELIGIAYLSELLRKYDGDVERALAAYNAGPGRVDAALSNDDPNWLAAMPAETQDYVARVG
jgi:hypothetical protein